MTQKNRLNAQQAFLLYKWFEQNQDIVKSMPYEILARKVTKEIGFLVTTSNVQGAFLVTKIERIEKKQTVSKRSIKPHQKFTNESTLMYRKIRSVTRALVTLCKELGHTPKNIDILMEIAEYEQ
jgi:hypothetical protein